MATTRLSGIDGSFKIAADGSAPAVVKGVKEWTVDLQAEAPDVTGFDSGGWRQTVKGLKSWSGTLTASWDTDATGTGSVLDLFNAEADVELYLDATRKITGNIVINSFSVRNSVEGAPEISINFSGDGAPVLP